MQLVTSLLTSDYLVSRIQARKSMPTAGFLMSNCKLVTSCIPDKVLVRSVYLLKSQKIDTEAITDNVNYTCVYMTV